VLALTAHAARVFEELGCDLVEVDRVMDEDPIALWTSEFYGGLQARISTEWTEGQQMLDPTVAAMLDATRSRSSEEQHMLVFRRYELREKLRLFFEHFDLLLTPTLPVAAFDVGLDAPPGCADRNPVAWAKYTYPFNLTGHPAGSVPAGFTRVGLPVGLQLVAGMNGETDIFRAAAAYEAARPWAGHRPAAIAEL
jgi:Asp-tRNA(Asn)/Glu-tRNA(Gln) amidotransferase A subunit family amidase